MRNGERSGMRNSERESIPAPRTKEASCTTKDTKSTKVTSDGTGDSKQVIIARVVSNVEIPSLHMI